VSAIVIKDIVDEDFINYKRPSMFIATSRCSFKCEKESGVRCCQNSALAQSKSIEIDDDEIITRYMQNPITSAIVFGGLEPFDQFEELYHFISQLRRFHKCDETVVIYTGYNKTEVSFSIKRLSEFKNIIIKFGRFIPNQERHFDEVLGVYLASPNQYAKEIS
jgi:organic radical activating enzyme